MRVVLQHITIKHNIISWDILSRRKRIDILKLLAWIQDARKSLGKIRLEMRVVIWLTELTETSLPDKWLKADAYYLYFLSSFIGDNIANTKTTIYNNFMLNSRNYVVYFHKFKAPHKYTQIYDSLADRYLLLL